MLTKSKVLSNKILSNTGLDISGSKLSNVVNNNITVTNKESCKARDINNPYDDVTIIEPTVEKTESEPVTFHCEGEARTSPVKEQLVKYPDPSQIQDELFGIDILKKIISLYSSNSLKLEGKLVVHSAELIDLIKSIMDAKCNADITVEIDIDYEINCCGTSKGLNCIDKILIKDCDENKTVDMKYKYNEEYNAIQQFGISLKFTVD